MQSAKEILEDMPLFSKLQQYKEKTMQQNQIQQIKNATIEQIPQQQNYNKELKKLETISTKELEGLLREIKYWNAIETFYILNANQIISYFEKNPFYLKKIDNDTFIFSGDIEFIQLNNKHIDEEIERYIKTFFKIEGNILTFNSDYRLKTDWNDYFFVYFYRLGMVIDSDETTARKFTSLRSALKSK
jgi:hypothetical protein